MKRPKLQMSVETLKRLKIQTIFHLKDDFDPGQIEWNRTGSKLACIYYTEVDFDSGNDGGEILIDIWDPFTASKATTIHTQTQGPYMCYKTLLKFMPSYAGEFIAIRSERIAKVLDVETQKTYLDCQHCLHDKLPMLTEDGTQQLETHPLEPFNIWVGDDDFVRQYDVREQHVCGKDNMRTEIVAVDKPALRLALNPARSEMLAVGEKGCVRLFDRRFSRPRSDLRFAASCLPHKKMHHLSFSADGSELLATISGNVFLYKTYEPEEPYVSFEATLKPLIDNLPASNSPPVSDSPTGAPFKPHCLWKDLKTSKEKSTELPSEHREFCDGAMRKISAKCNLVKYEYDKINQLLEDYKYCSELYLLRSSALWNRNRPSIDRYQSLRDLCCAVALDPSLREVPIIDTGDDLEAKRSFIMTERFEDEETRQYVDTCFASSCSSQEHQPALDSILEPLRCSNSYDYTKSFDASNFSLIAKFLGCNENLIVVVSNGALNFFDKKTANLVKRISLGSIVPGYSLAIHPNIYAFAMDGIESYRGIIFLSPQGEESFDFENSHLCPRVLL